MSRFRLYIFALSFLSLGLLQCGVSPKGTLGKNGQLLCQDANGNAVEAYTLYGKWKKTSGYSDDPRSSSKLSTDFDVYIFPKGASACMQPVLNGDGGQSAGRWFATYTHNVDSKNIFLTYTAGKSGSDHAIYSFSGGCSDLQMTLTYKSGTVEKFVMFNKDVSDDPCSLE